MPLPTFALSIVLSAAPAFATTGACDAQLVTAPPAPVVSAEHAAMVDREVQNLLDAFASGQVTGIDVVSTYGNEIGGLQKSLKSSALLKGSMDGPGVDQSMSDLEDQMTALTKIMKQFTPEELDSSRQNLKDRALRIFGLGRDRAVAITANFQSNEAKIAAILKGLGDGRAALIMDNELINGEVDRVRHKMIEIVDNVGIWKLRREKIEAFRDQLVAESRGGNGQDLRKVMQIDLVQNQLLLPIVSTIQMLQGQFDIFEAAVVAHRLQQDQNRTTIRSGENLERTAAEILPTLVTMGVTAARNSRVQSLQESTTQLMENSFGAITRQMDANAKRQAAALKAGPVDQEKIFQFREEVLRIVGDMQRSKGETFVAITAALERRDARVKSQEELISSLVNTTAMDLLPAPPTDFRGMR